MKKQLLYLDDDSFMQDFFMGVFGDQYDVMLFGTAEEAWKATQFGYRPDLMVVDLGLPGMSGREFVECLQGQKALAQIPVIVLSGDENSDTRIDLLEKGAHDFMVKPFTPKELELKINRILRPSVKKQNPHQTENAQLVGMH